MAELLAALLVSPGQLPDFSLATPPQGLEPGVWELRHELPLHFINFLRDQTESLLAQSQGINPTPAKGSVSRPSKYQYSSPLKSVAESPSQTNTGKTELNKKSKKKVKLFSGHSTGQIKGHKSFSEVEESLARPGSVICDGINRLPSTPNRSMVQIPEVQHKMRSPPSGSTQGLRQKFNNSNLSDIETPINAGSKIVRRISNKFSPSPQAFSISDYLTPTFDKRNNKKGKNTKSPSKMKASTPIDGKDLTPKIGEPKPINAKISNLNLRFAELDLDSEDAFPGLGESPVHMIKKRINPVQLGQVTPPGQNCSSPNLKFGQILERSINAESTFKPPEVERSTCDDLRDEMAKESVTRFTPMKGVVKPVVTPSKPQSIGRSNSVSSCSNIVANPKMVTHKQTLMFLSDLYSHILNNNLMPNLIVEIYFLIELLILEVSVDQESVQKDSDDEYFSSVHNCVFFSSLVLGQILPLLSPLDGTTLRLLSENSRLAEFSEFCPKLTESLVNLLQTRTVPSPSKSRTRSKILQNVSFQSETDNRSNFPSNNTFHDFKKQRDKFYALLRRWSEESKGPEYNFSQLAGDVRQVMALSGDDHPVNYGHFARLFRQQLVAMCQGEGLTGAMGGLRKEDPMKYKRLDARCTTPGLGGGPCPLPAFTGAAEFFRDFVISCRSPQFVQHLRDSLATEIRRLDCLTLEVGGGETWGSGLSRLEDSSMLELSQDIGELLTDQYQELLLTLRVLAKFLGFLESFPYSCEDLSEELAEAALAVRASVPVIDLSLHLRQAIVRGRLVLTLPWIVEFLSQLDQVTLALPSYKDLQLELAVLYQTRLTLGTPTILPLSASLLSLLLGWLFEGKYFRRELLIEASARLQRPESPCGPEADTLDLIDVVGPELVIQCCPWLGEIRSLLQRWEGARRGSQLSLDRIEGGSKNYKKLFLTPVERPQTIDQGAVLQENLEKNFFHNQPSALRRTVDFMAERLASNIIRRVRTDLVSEARQSAVASLESLFASQESPETALPCLQAAVTSLARDSQTFIRECKDLYFCLTEDCLTGLVILLSTDTSKAVRDTCRDITSRMVKDKVRQYMMQYITLEYFIREYSIEAERICRKSSKDPPIPVTTPSIVQHCPQASPPSQVLIEMKRMLRCLCVQRSNLTPAPTTHSLITLVDQITSCLTQRADLVPVATRSFESLSLDWVLTLITHLPNLVTQTLLDSLVSLWRLLPPPQMSGLLCPRNLVLLSQSSNPKDTWLGVELLLSSVLQSNLLPALALEDSCLSLQAGGQHDLTLVAATLNRLTARIKRQDMAWVEEVFSDTVSTERGQKQTL